MIHMRGVRREDFTKQLVRKMAPPLVTLLSSPPEVRFRTFSTSTTCRLKKNLPGLPRRGFCPPHLQLRVSFQAHLRICWMISYRYLEE
ncbi:hypothetical protein EDC04DRAFT_2817557 [Pisolithus marmoratus]|nr:hypothetical protein EDC04DRAFT_2817557 [Pisolithus marmoratus]